MYIIKGKEYSKDEMAKALSVFYLEDRTGIAKLCDEFLDQSGELLGIIRQVSANKCFNPHELAYRGCQGMCKYYGMCLAKDNIKLRSQGLK